MTSTPTYTKITIHPADENGSMEVWAEWVERSKRLNAEFDTDGIIGWLYCVGDKAAWVWLNTHGHPTKVFPWRSDVHEWLTSQCGTVEWVNTARV